MKKFISFLLVAMLVVTCMATVAFAAGSASAYVSTSQNVTPGQVVTLTVGVTGEFSNYEMTVSADSGLTITGISGVTANVANGKVAYSSGVNVTSSTFTVTVKVSENAKPGSYKVYATPTYGSMIVPAEQDTEDGVVDGRVRVELSGGAATLTIVCAHEWDDGVVSKEATCTVDGEKTFTCSLCGETKVETITAPGHKPVDCSKTDWNADRTGHFHDHTCSVCGEKIGDTHKEAHTMVPYKEETLDNGLIRYYRNCSVCGWSDFKDVEPGTPPTGDITTVLSAGSAAIFVSMMSVVALVVKRKAI